MEGSNSGGSRRPLKNQFSVQEWESLIEDFQYGGTRRERWTSQLSSPVSLIDLSLSCIFKKDFPIHLKINLLIFVEEFIADFSTFNASGSDSSDQLLSKLIEFLQVVIQSPNDGVSITFALKEQMLVSVTSITISVPYSSDHAPHISHLESLIAVLLTIINRPNHGIDRQTRAVACECLRQLEREYPGLLSEIVGHLWGLCQSERTHASQSYLLLILEVIHHIVIHKLSVSSIISTAIPLVPFSVPYWTKTSESGKLVASLDDEMVGVTLGRESSVSNIKELRRVMAFLLEWPQVLTPSGMMEFMSTVLPVAVDLELQVSLLKVQFFGLLYSSEPLLWHVVLMLYSRFSDAFDGLEDELFRRLTLISREGQQHLVFRLLILHWLQGFVGSSANVGKMRLIASKGSSFYPHVFDALALKALKLDLLALCSIFIDSAQSRGLSSIISQEWVSDATVVKYFEDGMVCLSTFKGLPPWSIETAVAFRTFHKFLIGSSIHSDSDPSTTKALMESIIFRIIERMFVKLLLDFDKLVPVVVALVDRLLGCQKHCWLGEKLLQTFDEHLLPKVAINSKMTSYFPIFDKIGKNESIPPCQLLELLVKLMVFLVDKRVPDTGLKSWSLASKVLGICRTMLMHHCSSRLFIGLSRLLAFTSLYFPDLEVRDNARIYLRMLVCIPGKKFRNLLSAGEQVLGVAQPAHESSYYDVQSPWLLQDLRKSKSISSYIHLERVVSLLVKQSWSLSLPALCCGADNFGFVEGVKDAGPPSDGRDHCDKNQAEFDPDVIRIDRPQEPLRVMDSQVSEMLEILRKHFSCIPDFRHMSGLKINIPCALRFNSEAFRRVWGINYTGNGLLEGDRTPAVYAVVLRFSSSAPYGPMPSYHIPFLIDEAYSTGNISTQTCSMEIVPVENGTTGKEFLKTPVMIELQPREPVPGLVDVSIEANTENGQIIRGQLQSISVGIEDLFLKAIVPPDIPEITVPDYYCDLFKALWEACGAPSSTGRERFSLKGGRGVAAITGTRSVKLLEVPADFVVRAIGRYLAPFVVCVIGETLIEVVKDGGILKNVSWKEFSADTALGSNAQITNSDVGPLYLTFNDEDDGDNVNVGKTSMGCFLVLIFLPPRPPFLLPTPAPATECKWSSGNCHPYYYYYYYLLTMINHAVAAGSQCSSIHRLVGLDEGSNFKKW